MRTLGITTESGTPLPSYHYSRFGGAGGGPIIPKTILGGKTYFFGNYEGFRWANSATIERAVPSANMRNGILTFAECSTTWVMPLPGGRPGTIAEPREQPLATLASAAQVSIHWSRRCGPNSCRGERSNVR